MNKNYCPYCMTPVSEGEGCPVCGLAEGSCTPSPHHLPPGTILTERYLVGRALGEGGFGITYIGRDLRLERKVAIKEYYPMDCATRNASASLAVTDFIGPSAESFARGRRRFLDEAQVMARMDKQQVIVGVRDFFEANNTAYIVMEYIEGITFRELVEEKGGRLAPAELFPMIEPLFYALSIMHENGLIHRDISPDNLMLEDGRVRLLDFGCAREASGGTETMTISLKHGYAPIEQYRQNGQGPWTDIYALCATIYYCLTGQAPPQPLDRITEDGLVPPGRLGVELTDAQEKALLRGLRLQPNRRYATVEELREVLCAPSEKAEDTVQAPPRAQWPAGRRKTLIRALSALALGMAFAAAVWMYSVKEGNAGVDAGQGGVTADDAVFDGAYRFTSGDCEEFMRLLDDDAVASIVVACDMAVDEGICISKPVRIAEGGRIQIGYLEVLADGYLQVEGVLDMPDGAYLRLFGEDVCLSVADGGSFAMSESGLIWMDHGDCLAGAGGLKGRKLVFSGEIFAQDSVISVTNFGELKEALGRGCPISIDADLTLTERIDLSVPVRIADGVTVRAEMWEEGFEGDDILVHAGGILLNDGTIMGKIWAGSRAAVINRASIRSPGREEPCAVWFEEDSLMINLGDMDADNVSRFWDSSALFNMGRLCAYDFFLAGGNLFNYGTIALLDDTSRFASFNGSRLINEPGGVITVAAGAEFENNGWALNFGDINVKEAESFCNAILENYGSVVVESGADIDRYRTSVYVGSGGYDFGQADVLVFATSYGEDVKIAESDKRMRVKTEEELVRALKNEEVKGVVVAADITVESDLTVNKAVCVEPGCSLVIKDQAQLVAYGGVIVLREDAVLRGSRLALHEGAQLFLKEHAQLGVSEGGSLTLDHALLWGEGGNVKMSGIDLVLKDGAAFAFPQLSDLVLDDSEITLRERSAFVVPCDTGMDVKNARITLKDLSRFTVTQDVTMTGCTLNIESGQLISTAKGFELRDCTVQIGTKGQFRSECTSLSLLGSTELINNGFLSVSGWDEYVFKADGAITNYGRMELGLKNMRLSEAIDNRGELGYWSSYRMERLPYVKGNAPFDLEQ